MDRQTLRDWVHRYEHAKGKPAELWWQDEARIGQQGTLTHVWGGSVRAGGGISLIETV